MFFDPEGSIEQRKFRLKQLKDLTPSARNMDFAAMEPAVFVQIEKVALKEARNNARNSGRLFKTTYRDDAGRKVSEFEGDIAAAFGPFMDPGYKAKLNLEPDVRVESVKLKPGQRLQIVG